MDFSSATAGALIAKFLESVPAGLGALVSLRFLPVHMSVYEKLFTLGSSYAIGTYFGRGFSAYINATNDRVVDMIVFGFAIFGLSFVGTIMSEMKPLIRALSHRWVGPNLLLKDSARDGDDV